MAIPVFNPAQTELTGKVVAALERVSEAFRVLLWEENRKNGLSPIQLQVLIFILHHGELLRTVSLLAEEFSVSRPTMSDVVRVLEQKGLVRKTPAVVDARSMVLSLTPLGRRLAKSSELFAEQIARPVDGLPQEQQEQLLDGLLIVIHSLHKEGIIKQQRMCLSCRFFERNKSGTARCNLLQQVLHSADLRIDCPEYELLQPA